MLRPKPTMGLAALVVIAVVPLAQATEAVTEPSQALRQVLRDIQTLKPVELMAVATWLKGEGRAKLRELGVTDREIGGARLNIDRFDDAPLGK